MRYSPGRGRFSHLEAFGVTDMNFEGSTGPDARLELPRPPAEILRDLAFSSDPVPTMPASTVRKHLLNALSKSEAHHILEAAKRQRTLWMQCMDALSDRMSNPDAVEKMSVGELLAVISMSDRHLSRISQVLLRDPARNVAEDAITLATILALTSAVHGAGQPASPADKPDLDISEAQDA